jgi:hypothetical protein
MVSAGSVGHLCKYMVYFITIIIVIHCLLFKNITNYANIKIKMLKIVNYVSDIGYVCVVSLGKKVLTVWARQIN